MRFLGGFFSRTPGPPPFSSMNSMPAASICRSDFSSGQFSAAKLALRGFEAAQW